MRKYLGLITALMSLMLLLSGCIGEDYDTGVPSAFLNLTESYHIEDIKEDEMSPLVMANVEWSTQSEDVHKEVKDIRDFLLNRDKIVLQPDQTVSIYFMENKENGGRFDTVEVSVSLLQNNQRIDIEMGEISNDFHTFNVPLVKGDFILEVLFASNQGNVQYVGNVLVK